MFSLTKKNLMVGRGRGGDVARVSDFSFFQKNPSLKKRCFVFRGDGKGGLASVSEFVLQKNPNLKKISFLCVCVWGGGGGGGLSEWFFLQVIQI